VAKRTKKRPVAKRYKNALRGKDHPRAVKRNAVSLRDWAGMFGGQVSPKILEAAAREYRKGIKNPRKKATAKMVKILGQTVREGTKKHAILLQQQRIFNDLREGEHARGRKNPTKSNPAAKKRKARKRPIGKRAKATRRAVAKGVKRNPASVAAQVYREFHGRDPDEVITITERLHVHDTLSGVGVMEWLKVAAIDGKTIVELSGFKGALLAQDEKKRQLYIEGGDQSVNISDFGIDPKRVHEHEVLGVATEVAYETRKDHLGEAGGAGERAVHVHKLGTRRGMSADDSRRGWRNRLPVVVYDTRNKKLSLVGGTYDLPVEGIRG
jgi:hypothetical protein